MKNILIISATKKTNYTLAKKLSKFLLELNSSTTVISLEDYMLPLYTDDVFDAKKNEYKDTIEILTKLFINHAGIIICGPEYNGSTAPIITNSIAWISCSTDYWKDAFKNKIALIATASGGPGTKFVSAIKTQLEHLGCVVMPNSISANNSNPLNTDSVNKILRHFIKSC